MSRAGRKRKNAARTHTGQISRARAVVEREATSVACEARARLHGLPIASARHAEAGSALGRMLLRDQITRGALCPMCSTGMARWTVGLVCQLCGTDYSRPDATPETGGES